jgi:hypothetical protein
MTDFDQNLEMIGRTATLGIELAGMVNRYFRGTRPAELMDADRALYDKAMAVLAQHPEAV